MSFNEMIAAQGFTPINTMMYNKLDSRNQGILGRDAIYRIFLKMTPVNAYRMPGTILTNENVLNY
jgi:hypothetical protein